MKILLCRYAVGGRDGIGMVSSVEIFDPRAASWMIGESLNGPRGCFGAVSMADSLFVFGGVDENRETLDTVCKCFHMEISSKFTIFFFSFFFFVIFTILLF